jgi:hypothetical protein
MDVSVGSELESSHPDCRSRTIPGIAEAVPPLPKPARIHLHHERPTDSGIRKVALYTGHIDVNEGSSWTPGAETARNVDIALRIDIHRPQTRVPSMLGVRPFNRPVCAEGNQGSASVVRAKRTDLG